ncbi:Y' element ATP-dependent helicase YJL225C [Drosophila teissieri]|uniref:Y' element ATP-dependent helicase YJL225C n=1 Tax=Drosophila teissieri TaxID=7243 RepID=UPI001CB9EB2B|nr:Y' element ATP-dependent helicase YJL225C [Drosophila teissieri]
MTAFNQDHHFVLLLIVALVGSNCILEFSDAQTFTAEDRNSIQKFMDSLLNFLELEISNITTTLPPNSNSATLVTTSPEPGTSTEVTTEALETSTNSTSIVLDSSTPSLLSTTKDSENTTATTTTEANPTTVRRRICFKRFCYKFSNDKGYIV